jgi:hypothetical protein
VEDLRLQLQPDTDEILQQAGLAVSGLRPGTWKLMSPLIRPLILGATAPV